MYLTAMHTQFVKSSVEKITGNSAQPEIWASGFYILNRCQSCFIYTG